MEIIKSQKNYIAPLFYFILRYVRLTLLLLLLFLFPFLEENVNAFIKEGY